MIEFLVFWVAALASFALGWVVRRGVAESILHDDKELDLAYAQGVADERAASRKRGQELAEAVEKGPVYAGHWPS